MKYKIFTILALFFILTAKSFALVSVDITRGNLDPLPTAISDFYLDSKLGDNIKKLQLESKIPELIQNNLSRSGLFFALEKKSLAKSKDLSDLLWSIWSNAKNYDGESIANLWQKQALAGGNKGGIADQNLDAVITLFEVARRFSERLPGAKVGLFIDQLLGEKILADSITASAQRSEVVKVLTVHSTKGLQWRYVALAGMQDGSWPNLKQRGSLLGTERLVEIFRHGISNPEQLDAIAASGLAEDELRLLNVATSRSTEKLFITAVVQEDNQPSRYFEKYAPDDYQLTQNERSITQPAIVATLRRMAMQAQDAGEIEFATSALKTLADAGVRSADPKNWVGIKELSTSAPVIGENEQQRISPSSLESFTECGLKWLLEQSGGKDADSTAQVLGTAIHVIAAQLKQQPELSLAQLEAKLKGAWTLIDMNKGWIKDYEYRRAAQMLQKFYGWNLENKNQLVSVEERFEFKLGNSVISGSIDRIARFDIHWCIAEVRSCTIVDCEVRSDDLRRGIVEIHQIRCFVAGDT